jgi:hypothetical protein
MNAMDLSAGNTRENCYAVAALLNYAATLSRTAKGR